VAAANQVSDILSRHDVDAYKAYWAAHFAHLPQFETRAHAEIAMHQSCTAAESVPLRARAYSNAWLVERGHLSALPDHLKPKAAQICPVRKVAVGIGVGFRSPWMKGAEAEVRGAMEQAVLEADADGRIEDTAFVSARMAEAKEQAMRQLFGGR